MSEFCNHYRAMAEHKTCELGIEYESVRATPGKYEFPCHDSAFKTCPLAVYPTTEEIDKRASDLSEMLNQFFDKLKANVCPYCDQPIKHKEQIGRCVYAEPCGCRLYQGKLKK